MPSAGPGSIWSRGWPRFPSARPGSPPASVAAAAGGGAAPPGLTSLRVPLETSFSGWTVLEGLPQVAGGALRRPVHLSLGTCTLSVTGKLLGKYGEGLWGSIPATPPYQALQVSTTAAALTAAPSQVRHPCPVLSLGWTWRSPGAQKGSVRTIALSPISPLSWKGPTPGSSLDWSPDEPSTVPRRVWDLGPGAVSGAGAHPGARGIASPPISTPETSSHGSLEGDPLPTCHRPRAANGLQSPKLTCGLTSLIHL